MDWGVYDDLSPSDRRAYRRNVLTLTHTESQFLIYVHQWPLRWHDQLIRAVFGHAPMQPGEVAADFGSYFYIEKLMEHCCSSGYLAGEAAYLMRRKG